MTALRWVGSLFLTGSCFFFLAAVLGMLRFPDVYTRLHAGTKAVTAGSILLLMGVAMWEASWHVFTKLLLIGLFLLVTNPIANHAIARASYRRGVAVPHVVMDQYRKYLFERGLISSPSQSGDQEDGEQG